MKKSLFLSLSAAAILSVSAFAHMSNDDDNYSRMGMNQQGMMGKNYSNNHMMGNRSGNMMQGNYGNSNQHMMNGYGHMSGYGMMGGSHMGYGMMHNSSMMGAMMILPKIMMLDLSKDQQIKIGKILRSNDGSSENPLDAFSETKFDKEKFTKAVKKNRDMMIELHAQKISKIYSVLDSEQKKDLKKILDVEDMFKNRGMNSSMHNMMNR